MKTKLKCIIIASLLFGASGFNSAKAITADELLATIIVPVYQFVIDTFTAVGQVLVNHDTRISDNEARATALETADFGSQITGLESRIATLEAEPKANIAIVAPAALDDINGGFTEGSVWIDMTDKEAYILVDSTSGAAVWKRVSKNYAIGDTGPAGGIVFYVTDNGLHGLEAAPADLGLASWGCLGALTGASGIAVGTGVQNTSDILANCNEPGIAAELASAYSINGESGWYLPSIDELKLLYFAQHYVGGFDYTAIPSYWSSTEDSSNGSRTVSIRAGDQGSVFKTASQGVRPIRAF